MDAVERLKRGELAIIASTIFDEGVDIPEVGSLILAVGGKSTIKTLQRVGRALRPKKGENEVEIYDFIDWGNKYLLSHSRQRLQDYMDEGFHIDE